MEVKVCPKCKAENKPANASCSNCYSSLEGVEVTLSERPDEPVVVQPKAPAAPQPAAPQAPPNPYGPPPGSGPGRATAYPPGTREGGSYQEKKGSGAWAVILVLILLLGGGGFAAWYFLLNKAGGPEQVVLNAVEALKQGDFTKLKSYMTESSANMFNMIPGGEAAMKTQFDKAKSEAAAKGKSFDDEFKVKIVKTSYDGDDAIVDIAPPDKSEMAGSGMDSLPIVLTKAEGDWKIDLTKTMAKAMEKAMSGMKGGMPGGGMPSGGMPGGPMPTPPAPSGN